MKKFILSLTFLLVANVVFSQSINGHDYVDMGFPSGTKWATCNVGSQKPQDFGMYFAWGETKGFLTEKKDDGKGFQYANYKFYRKGNSNDLIKYLQEDHRFALEDCDDAATVNWGNEWCMPTVEQAKELLENCSWSPIVIDGNKCYKFVSKLNGRFILIPCSGSVSFDLSLKNSCLYCWLKNKPYLGFADYIGPCLRSCGGDNIEVACDPQIPLHAGLPRHMGLSVRPVVNKNYSAPSPSSNGSQKNFCTQCGNKVEPSHKFCANCGSRL